MLVNKFIVRPFRMKRSLKILIFASIINFIQASGKGRPLYSLDSLAKNIHKTTQDIKGENPHILPKDIFYSVKNDYYKDNSTKCAQDIMYTSQNLKEQWALHMLDAFGKPESGFLVGNTHWLGDYVECLNVYAPPTDLDKGDFHGRYCSLVLTIPTNSTLQIVSLTIGVCLPDSCSTSETSGTGVLQPPNLGSVSAPTYKLQCQARERHLNGPAKGVIALLSIFCVLALIGSSITVVKYFMEVANYRKKTHLLVHVTPSIQGDTNEKPDIESNGHVIESDGDVLLHNDTSSGAWEKCEAFFECFCIFKNGEKILNTDTREGEMLCIHGIRFLSMSWVILGHAYIFGFAEIRNLYHVFDLIKNWPFQVVLQGFYSVDSFFVLSGFLMTYLFMQESAKKDGRINWLYFYVHRYIRLTPVYMITLAFSATVFLALGFGPFWPQNDIDDNCKNNWWWNLLYINNFLGQNSQCMGWAWYLANDMQFFVISPIILIPLWRWPKVGLSILCTLLCACWVSSFVLTYHFDLLMGMANILSLPVGASTITLMAKFGEYFDKLYDKPYTRIAPYLIGMLTGYLLFSRKKSTAPKHKLTTISIGWMVATTIALACTYGLYQQDPGLVGKSFYNALSRTAWAVGLCWVIYVCLIDQGDLVNRILSFKLFIPLSRLTYTAYLIHPMIIMGYFANLKTTFVFSHPNLVLLYLGIMVITYALALPVTLVFESPVIALEKMVRKSFTKQD